MLSTTTTSLPLPRPSPPRLYYLSSCRTTPPSSFSSAAGSCCFRSGAGRRHERAGGHGLRAGHGGAQQDGDGEREQRSQNSRRCSRHADYHFRHRPQSRFEIEKKNKVNPLSHTTMNFLNFHMFCPHHKRSSDCAECITNAQEENGRIHQNLTRCKGPYRVWAYVKLSIEAAVMLCCKILYLFMITVLTSVV